ncbi:MAG: cytochrome c oxidase subunit 3 [Chitinophagales bacterium]|nr:cytochrome c oxidase subunit 3 [Chitinophagales bacterium]
MSQETAVQQQKNVWDGGVSPFSVSYGKLMMWYFLVSDAFSFAALLITYAALRVSSPWWPNPNEVFSAFPGIHKPFPLGFVTLMTFILIMSSVFVVRAVQEGHRMNRKGVMFWMFLGIIGGAAFLGCQAFEWSHLISEGMTLFNNPFGPEGFVHAGHHSGGHEMPLGPRLFGCLFFTITGFHGFHVFTGVLINCIIFIQSARGVYDRRGHYEMVEKVGLYWHFVDLVWVFVFLAFYLL